MIGTGNSSGTRGNGEAQQPDPVAGQARFGGELEAKADHAPETRRKRRTGVGIVVLVIGLAIGGMIAMRAVMMRTSGEPMPPPIDLSMTPEQMDQMIDEINQGVKDLTGDYNQGQVEEVRNPFAGERPDLPPPPLPGLSRPQRAAEQLTLSAVMGGASPLAVINRASRRVGDVIPVDLGDGQEAVKFKVMQITSDSVTLEAEGADPPFETVIRLRRGR